MSENPQDLGGPERVRRTLHNMETYVGYVPGFRRAHARGIALRGRFEATAEVAALTMAEHMRGDAVAVVVRLSNGAGNPYTVDRSSVKRGAVLGLAVRFELPSGAGAEWAALNIADFPAREPEDFTGLSAAQRRGLPTGLPNPLRLGAYVATHPQCAPGLKAILTMAPSQSFATASFNGLHAYHLVDSAGTRRAFRYRWEAVAEPAGISPEEDRVLPPQYLLSEIKLRVAREPVAWDLVLQMAGPGDPVDDMTKHWPQERRRLPAGRLVLDRLHEDQELVERSMFDPTNQPPGIALSDDPVLHFRSESYLESQRRRQVETKPAVKPE
ncbi:MAG: catalase [Solirubrobacteraceae bacterium]|nr:catalase [Solirubrobacteraceae bacterium]